MNERGRAPGVGAQDKVARNRDRLFGKYNACVVPTPDHLARFPGEGVR